jgi:hypothetical protein
MPMPREQAGFRLIDGGDFNQVAAAVDSLQGATGVTPGPGSFTNVVLTGLLSESTTDNITAFATGGQANATKLVTEVNRITVVATAGDSVALPIATLGLTVYVINKGTNQCQVFGNAAAGDVIDDGVTTAGVTQMQSSTVLYTCTTVGRWYTEGLATGYSGQLQTVLPADTITAHAGGGQAAATQLVAMINRVTVVATAADSVKLPPSAVGLQIALIHDGANALQVFGAGTDTIDGVATATGVVLSAAKRATFYCTTAGQWTSSSGAKSS